MTTRTITLGREKRLATLARKVYTIDRLDSAKLQARAEAALLRANPQLANREAFRLGATIVVPPVMGLQLKPGVNTVSADAKGLGKETTARLRVTSSRIEEQFRLSNETAEKTLALVATDEFQSEVRKSIPEAEPLIKAAQVAIKKQAGESAEKNARLQEAISEAIKGVEALQSLVERDRNN